MKKINRITRILLIAIFSLFLFSACDDSETELRNAIKAWSDATTTQDLQQLYLYTANGGEFADLVIMLKPEYEKGRIIQFKFEEITIVVHSEWSVAQVECIMKRIIPGRGVDEDKILVTAEYINGVWKLKRLSVVPDL